MFVIKSNDKKVISTYIPEDDAIVDATIKDGWPKEMVLATYEYLLRRTGKEKKINNELITKVTQFINDLIGHRSEETKYPESMLEELATQLGFKKQASKFAIKSSNKKLVKAGLSQEEKDIAFEYFKDCVKEIDEKAIQNNEASSVNDITNMLKLLVEEKTLTSEQYDYLMKNFDYLLRQVDKFSFDLEASKTVKADHKQDYYNHKMYEINNLLGMIEDQHKDLKEMIPGNVTHNEQLKEDTEKLSRIHDKLEEISNAYGALRAVFVLEH